MLAMVRANEPAVFVTSPVCAGSPAAGNVPVVSPRLIFNVLVATHCGTPEAEVVRMFAAVEESVFIAVPPDP